MKLSRKSEIVCDKNFDCFRGRFVNYGGINLKNSEQLVGKFFNEEQPT